MKKLLIMLMIALLAQGCSKQVREEPSAQNRITGLSTSVFHSHPAQPSKQATLDPKSSEAAAEVLRVFVDLLNARKFDEAYMLLGASAPPREQFDTQFSRYLDLKVTTGSPGDQEGAAGSVYLSIPITISGRTNGQRTTRSASAILRRINDVPGSTEAERHWHIEKLEWKTAP